jgi:agmatinase
MKIYYVPGINGLGKTRGVDENEFLLKGFDYEKLNLSSENIKLQLSEIYSFFNKLGKKKFFILGGDHSVTYPIFKSFFKKYGESTKLLVFDAHLDLMKPMAEPTHEEWLRAVLERDFNPKNILIVGIRRESENIDASEKKYANKKNIKIIYSDEFEKKIGEILDFVSAGKIYFSCDIDVFDSSIISCTGYPETQGLFKKQIFKILEKIFRIGNILYFDLVEINLRKGSEKSKKNVYFILRKIIKLFNKSVGN